VFQTVAGGGVVVYFFIIAIEIKAGRIRDSEDFRKRGQGFLKEVKHNQENKSVRVQRHENQSYCPRVHDRDQVGGGTKLRKGKK